MNFRDLAVIAWRYRPPPLSKVLDRRDRPRLTFVLEGGGGRVTRLAATRGFLSRNGVRSAVAGNEGRQAVGGPSAVGMGAVTRRAEPNCA